MDEVRDKLVELLEDDRCPMLCVFGDSVGGLADYLIANGVTIPEWIPVTERLPEDDLPKSSKVKQIKVLTALKSDKGVRTVRSQMRFRCTWYNAAPWAWKYSGSEITHWMPLPQAPRKEGS